MTNATEPDSVMTMKFRKKPVVIEAIQLSSSPGKHGDQIKEWAEVESWGGGKLSAIGNNVNGQFEAIAMAVRTLEGTLSAMPGDWIIRGIKGEVYPCRPDIFDETYEPAP